MINIDNIKVQIQTNNRNVYQWIDDVFIYINKEEITVPNIIPVIDA